MGSKGKLSTTAREPEYRPKDLTNLVTARGWLAYLLTDEGTSC